MNQLSCIKFLVDKSEMMEILDALRKTCESRKIPIISIATETFLGRLLKKLKPKICLEIGGAVGYSSIFMARTIEERKGEIVSFEISYPAYLESLQNARDSHCHNSITYPYDVRQAPIEKLMKTEVDFVFIDGQKSQYGEYMEIIEKIISPHTVIVIDDVIKYHNKLESLYGFLQKKQIKYEIQQLDPDDGIMIING